MSDNIDCDNAHEVLHRLILSKISSASKKTLTLQGMEIESRKERNKLKEEAGIVQD